MFKDNQSPYIGKVGQEILLVNTLFEPIQIDIEMTTHDADTISYMLEGSQLRDLDNGLVTTFNDKSEIYHQAEHFTLKDQYGNEISLSDYKGKIIFLNFWATWCPPCRAEMPDIQKLYERSPREGKDAVIVLGVAAPKLGGEKDEAGIKAFMDKNGYAYPVLMDKKGKLFEAYGIRAIPTTYLIDRNGNIIGRVQGALSAENIERIVQEALSR